MDFKEELRGMGDEFFLKSDSFKAFADIWDTLNAKQKARIKQLYKRSDKLISDLCRVWADYDIPLK
jgi:hypothetical protein